MKALGVIIDFQKLYFEIYDNGVHYWHLSEVDFQGNMLCDLTQSKPAEEKKLTNGACVEGAGFTVNIPVQEGGELIGNINILPFKENDLYMGNIRNVLERAATEIIRLLPGEKEPEEKKGCHGFTRINTDKYG